MAALAIVIASGVVPGLWAGRWSGSDDLAARVARLDQVPLQIGDWRGQALDLDPRMAERAELAGHLMRRYEDSRGHAVTILLVIGRPGPISVHTPEVCYGGVGYEPSTPKAKCPIAGERAEGPDEFWLADFMKPEALTPDHLRILYSWTTDGFWTASSQPRVDFAGSPALYKLYIVRATSSDSEPAREDPGVRFAQQFLPSLRKSLFSAP